MCVFEKLIEILENYVEADEIKSENSFKSDLGMSSFDIICFVSDIERKFGVKLKATDFIAKKTVGEMAEYIDSLM